MTRILFQLNLAKMRASFDDPLFDDFRGQLAELHATAEACPGFVWRYQGEKDECGFIKPYPNAPLIMGNMTAWRDYQSLYSYTFSKGHLQILKEKRKWFEQLPTPYTVLYYGDESDLLRLDLELLEEAKGKLGLYNIHGETPAAFGFGPHKGEL